jgi:tetratricopeptide (TPR) repeat protein
VYIRCRDTGCSRHSQFFSGYHYALGNLAKVRIEQKRYKDAIDLLRKRYRAAAHAENLYDLGEALELASRAEEAKKAFAEFQTKSLVESARADNSNRELITPTTRSAEEGAGNCR